MSAETNAVDPVKSWTPEQNATSAATYGRPF